MSAGLRQLFAKEDSGEARHVYQIGMDLLLSDLTPLALKIELVKILLPFRLPRLSEQTIDVHNDQPGPIQRLTILNLLTAERIDPATRRQLREYFLEDEQKQLLAAPEAKNEPETEFTS